MRIEEDVIHRGGRPTNAIFLVDPGIYSYAAAPGNEVDRWYIIIVIHKLFIPTNRWYIARIFQI